MQLLLQKDEILDAGAGNQGVTVICHAGSCWLTISGDDRDYLLGSGKNLELGSSGKVCITALEETRVQLLPAADTQSWRQKLAPPRWAWSKKRALPY